MKQVFVIALVCLFSLNTLNSCAQADKSKRPSPPAVATQKIGSTTVTMSYSQPSVKGRTIGTDLEPMEDKVWRAGANEATVFEIDKDVILEGKLLPKGKYGFFILVSGEAWTLIFNKTWDQWGAFKYNEKDDVLRIGVRDNEVDSFSEKLTYKIDADGTVHILWGDRDVSFVIQEKK